MLTEVEVAGVKRIVGSFTEASSFASMTLGYFAFTSRLWLLGIRPRVTLILTLLELFALVFSTSTTGYVGLTVFLLLSYLSVLIEMLGRPLTSQKMAFLLVLPVAVVSLMIVVALNDDYSASVKNMLDMMVFNKMTTDSGIERSSWNSQALQNLFDTFGFGVGNGSLRASSFPIGVLASLGVIGGSIFGTFLVKVLVNRAGNGAQDPLDSAYREAAKAVCVAWLITATSSGALIDLGLPFFAFAALACSKSYAPRAANAANAGRAQSLVPS